MASASTWPLSRQTALDLNGDVVPGARLTFFVAGTASTPLTVFEDPALTVPLPAFPDYIEADANGRWPRIYLPYEDYRERITTPQGTLIWDDDGIANPAPAANGGSIPASQYVQTGSIIPALALLDGCVRLNGRTMGSAVSGATERAADDTLPLYTHLWHAVDNAIATVSGGRGDSPEVDFASGKTIVLPDFRGLAMTGLAGMGNTATAVFDGLPFAVGNSILPGSRLGSSFQALTIGQLAAHAHVATSVVTDPGHTHEPSDGRDFQTLDAGSNSPDVIGGGSQQTFTTNSTALATTGITVETDVENTGSGEGHPNVQPSGLVVFNIKL